MEKVKSLEKIVSTDGTPIAVHRSGEGPPLVLVHGSSGSAARWKPVLPGLEAHFSVCAVERRGYGASGDGDAYALEREIEDIVAVIDALGEPAHLLGHSFGGLVTLEAALRTPGVRRLILYEPPIPLPGVVIYQPGVLDRLQALLDAGEREAVLLVLFREVVLMPPHEIAALQSSPTWPLRIASAQAVVREARAELGYRFEPQRFAALRTPTLLLMGSDSPAFLTAGTAALEAALPHSRVAVMPGQQHIAMNTAPELFLNAVLTFLREEAEEA